MKLKDLKKDVHPKILLQSAAGKGKTAFSLTGGAKVHMLCIDENIRTGITFQDAFTNERMKAEVDFIEDVDPLKPTSYKRAKDVVKKVAKECAKGEYKYKVFVIDSLTSLSEHCMNYCLGNMGHLGKTPEIQHWGAWTNELNTLFQIIKSLPICVMVLCHEYIETVNGKNVIKLSCPGNKLPPKIMSKFDEIWRIEIKPKAKGESDYVIKTKPNSFSDVRSCSQLKHDTLLNEGLVNVLKMIGYEI